MLKAVLAVIVGYLAMAFLVFSTFSLAYLLMGADGAFRLAASFFRTQERHPKLVELLPASVTTLPSKRMLIRMHHLTHEPTWSHLVSGVINVC